MSRPESVSSRTANFGWSPSSCGISARFFSPPEKPSFRYRLVNALSMPSCPIFSFSSLWKSSTPSFSLRRLLSAVRRKLERVTPGISAGYWNDRNSPRLARSFGGGGGGVSPPPREPPLVVGDFGGGPPARGRG